MKLKDPLPFVRGLFCWLISRFETILRVKIPFSTRSSLAIELKNAVAVVQKEIRGLRAKYESVTKTEEQDPIMVEGKNRLGIIANKWQARKTSLRFCLNMIIRFGVCMTKDAPRAMWEDLGRELGLEHVWLGGSIKARQKRRKCSKCGKYYVGHPALSRKYNKTEILFGVWSEGGSCGF